MRESNTAVTQKGRYWLRRIFALLLGTDQMSSAMYTMVLEQRNEGEQHCSNAKRQVRRKNEIRNSRPTKRRKKHIV